HHHWECVHTGAAAYGRAWAAGAGMMSSSVGRLFDAAAAMVGLIERGSYDGQAPALVESASGEISLEPALPVRPEGTIRRI
ncbi:hypothetical protein, partial [Enterococcus faecalis]|uniref:Kae1-like domain-containing protein n=1 Tax=Enterococcus faecalis TaxID=1351 RepID=UPI003D6A661C